MSAAERTFAGEKCERTMRWSDVDLERRTAWVHADEAKGGTAIGVPLNDEAIAVLREEIGKHRDRVFTFRRRPLANANTKAWKNALRRAGIEHFRWHDLRHVWATWHLMAGTTLGELQELGAWKSEAMVRRYPTSRRSKCAKRPTDLLRFGIQHRKKLRPKGRKYLALPERGVTLYSGHIGNTSALCGSAKCLGRSVTRWMSVSDSCPACSTARRWQRCVRS